MTIFNNAFNTSPDHSGKNKGGGTRVKAASALLLLSIAFNGNTEEYDPNRDQQLLACDRIYDSGEIQQAISCYTPLRNSSSLHTAAEAAWALGDTKSANELFRRATQEQPNNPHVRARWGRLFLSTHQPLSLIHI